MSTFKVNDGTQFEMNYEVIENILPRDTLFLHGNLSSNRWWYPASEIWKKKAIDKKLTGHMILAEFRGFGLSSKPQSVSEIDVKLFANDFLQLIKFIKYKKLNLVGHSTGGIIAAIMLATDQKLFNKVLLIDPIGATGFRLSVEQMFAFTVMKYNKPMTAASIGSVIYGSSARDDFFNNVIVEDAFKSVEEGRLLFNHLSTLNVADTLNKINNEILVIHGEQDKFLPITDSIKLSALFKNGKFMAVPEQGHSIQVENPPKFVEIANKFLFE